MYVPLGTQALCIGNSSSELKEEDRLSLRVRFVILDLKKFSLPKGFCVCLFVFSQLPAGPAE